jgi:hypothetical protein
MAIVTFSYTLPSDPEALNAYEGKAKGWVDLVLSERNAKQVRVYRSSDGKEVMTVTEVQSLAELEKFLASDRFRTLRGKLEEAGCGAFQLRTWEVSPVAPKAMERASLF